MIFDREKFDAVITTSVIRSDGHWACDVSAGDRSNLRLGGIVKTPERDYLEAVATLTGIGALKKQRIEPGARILIANNSPHFLRKMRANEIATIYAPNQVKAALQRAMGKYDVTFTNTEKQFARTLNNWAKWTVQDYSGSGFPVSTASQFVEMQACREAQRNALTTKEETQ
jgi:hypothetical protein